MSETRSPEAMPTAWTVESFAPEQGFGTLCHASGEQVTFTLEAWNLGDWKPTLKELAITGAASPLLPRPGEPVRVQWRRAATGKNVPRLVQPTARVSPERKAHDLGAWLAAVQKHTGHLPGLTAAELLEVLARIDEDACEKWEAPRETWEYAFLLMDLAFHADDDAAWRPFAAWIYADDHRWDRTRAHQRLPAMLGLAAGAVPTAGDGYRTGPEESLSEYAAKCNAAAASAGVALRLHELDLHGDSHVFVCLPPAAFDALTKGGYLDPADD